MSKPASILYDAATGASFGPVDVGEGLRQKSWAEEVSQWALQAASTPGVTTNIIPVNWPEFKDGYRRHAKPIGQNTPGQLTPDQTGGFKSLTAFEVSPVSGIALSGSHGVTPFTGTFSGRVLPLTVKIFDGALQEGADDGLGALVAFGAGDTVTAGAINYSTGAITATTFSADPSTDATASGSKLIALDLSDPVRIPAGGKNFALLATYK